MNRRGRPPYPDVLTPREWEVLHLLRDGLTNHEIGERLGISPDGAKYHVSEILGKLGLSSRKEAARWQPRPRPWWAAAPGLGWLWSGRAVRSVAPALSRAALAASGALLIGALTGLALMTFLFLRGNGGPAPETVTSSPVAPDAGAVPLEPSLIGVMPNLTSPDAVWSLDGEALVVAKESGLLIARAPEFTLELLVGPGIVSRLFGGSIVWSPDGSRLAFAGDRTDETETIYVVNVDDPCCNARDVLPADSEGSGKGVAGRRPNVWLDNETVAFDATENYGPEVPMVVNIETGDVREVTSFRSRVVRWSPDRQWVVLKAPRRTPLSGTLRVLHIATGETWDLPMESDSDSYLFQAWLADSSGLLYLPSGRVGVLKVAYVDERRIVTMAEGETTPFQSIRKSLISPDGRFATVQGITLGDCPPRAERGFSGQCLSFLDVESGEPVSSVYFAGGQSRIADGTYGQLEWVGNDAVAFVGLMDDSPRRVLWLIQNPAQPQRIVWQEETPLHGVMGIDPSPDGQYAVITNPTSYGPNVWEARIYLMR